MIILFGAGIVGRMALEKYGKNSVAYFCDNYCTLQKIDDIEVIDFEKLKSIYKDYKIIVTPWNSNARLGITKLLENNNIPYTIYKPKENGLIPPQCPSYSWSVPFSGLRNR